MRLGRVIACAATLMMGAATACSPASTASATHPAPSCPPCACTCECEPGAVAGIDPYERDEAFAAATRKAAQGDGAGCLAELDRGQTLDPRPRFDTANPESPYAQTRAQCLMLAGQCDAGKTLARAALEQTTLQQWGPEQVERTLEAYTSMYCRGRMSDREALLQSLMELQKAAYTTTRDARFCETHDQRIARLRTRVKPRDDDDAQILHLDASLVHMVPTCYQRAGDCSKAWARYRELAQRAHPHVYGRMSAEVREQSLRSGFDSTVSKCKGKS